MASSRIKKARLARSLTLDELATASGISKTYLWELENGRIKSPSARVLYSIARALKLNIEYLMGYENAEARASDRAFLREFLKQNDDNRARIRRVASALMEDL